jgi:RNA polymerase sigma-70 factor (ECF subfamily)
VVSPVSATPVSLLERLRRPDDAAAWSRFVRLYTPLLYAWARRTGLQAADAADLVQDVFAVLVQKLPAFAYNPNQSFRSWMRTILLNRWRALQRRRQPAALGAAAEELPEPENPELPGVAEERRQLLQRALALLEGEFEPATWQAFRQTAVLGQPAAEVAAGLGLSANAVYIARSRVLKRLRQELAGLLD